MENMKFNLKKHGEQTGSWLTSDQVPSEILAIIKDSLAQNLVFDEINKKLRKYKIYLQYIYFIHDEHVYVINDALPRDCLDFE